MMENKFSVHDTVVLVQPTTLFCYTTQYEAMYQEYEDKIEFEVVSIRLNENVSDCRCNHDPHEAGCLANEHQALTIRELDGYKKYHIQSLFLRKLVVPDQTKPSSAAQVEDKNEEKKSKGVLPKREVFSPGQPAVSSPEAKHDCYTFVRWTGQGEVLVEDALKGGKIGFSCDPVSRVWEYGSQISMIGDIFLFGKEPQDGFAAVLQGNPEEIRKLASAITLIAEAKVKKMAKAYLDAMPPLFPSE